MKLNLKVFLAFFILNIVAAGFFLPAAFLNEDAALILGAKDSISSQGLFHWFTHSYGPDVIRPFMLFSFWIDEILFGTNPLGYHIESILLLSLAQLTLLKALQINMSGFFPFIALLPLSLSRTASESTLWLSDRHDLFLLLFFSLALLSWLRGKSYGLLVITYLLAFLSNEKGLALPLIVPLIGTALDKRSNRDCILRALVAGLLVYLAYIPYRSWLLGGKLIGGYHNSVLPEDIGIIFVIKWVISLFLSPFRGAYPPLELIIVASLLLIFFLHKAALGSLGKPNLISLFLAVLIAGIPTIGYAPEIFTSHIFSSRMLWLPLMVSSILFSLLWMHIWLFAGQLSKRYMTIWFFFALSILVYGRIETIKDFLGAKRYTEKALTEFNRVGLCPNPKIPRVQGLLMHFGTVNVFTEAQWLDFQSIFEGKESCENKNSYLAIHDSKRNPHFIPIVEGVARTLIREDLPCGESRNIKITRVADGDKQYEAFHTGNLNAGELVIWSPRKSYKFDLSSGNEFAITGKLTAKISMAYLTDEKCSLPIKRAKNFLD